mgnify:CR=1 FL=1
MITLRFKSIAFAGLIVVGVLSTSGTAAAQFMGGGGGQSGEDPDFQMRVQIARISAQLTMIDDPANAEVSNALDQKITLSFPGEAPWEEVLKQIKAEAKTSSGKPIPIYVDPISLSEAEKTMTSPVTIDLADVPLRHSLRLVLKQLGLAYCVRDGVLIISSVKGVYQELMEARAEQAIRHPDVFPNVEPVGMGGMGGIGGGMR